MADAPGPAAPGPATTAAGAVPGAGASMRLDRFLWHARMAKSRSAAQTLACTARMRIDGRTIDRPAAPVRIGNILTFAQHDRVRVIRIEALPTRRGPPAEARLCYQELTIENRSQEARDD